MAACQNAALQQVNQFWSMLDDLAQNNPGTYKTFIERQMRDGADYFSPPQPHSCLQTSVQKPEKATLFVNICGWKRVSAPSSPTHPIPVYGGRMETIPKENEKYNVVEVAFNPEVLQRVEKDPQEKEQIHFLALSFIQQQHKVSLSKHFSVIKAKLKGSIEDMKHRLMSPQQTKASTPNKRAEPAPSLLQQICLLRMEESSDDSSIQLTIGQEEEAKAKSGLIEVISSTETVQPRQPKHQLTVCPESGELTRSLKLHVELPGVSSVSQCQLSISQEDVLLEVEDTYLLHLRFPEPVNEEECHAVFNKKKHTLTVTASLL